MYSEDHVVFQYKFTEKVCNNVSIYICHTTNVIDEKIK